MDDKEKIQSFGDMIDATERLTKPWKRVCLVLACAIVAITLILSGVIFYLVHCAYMTPADMQQEQLFTEQQQSQSYTSGVTGGK